MAFFRAGCAGYFLLLAQEKVTKEKGTPTAGSPSATSLRASPFCALA